MTTGVLLALMFTVGLPQVPSAQVTGAQVPAPAAVQEVRPAPHAPGMTSQHRRDQIGVMEGVLAAAVRLGAGQAARGLQANGAGPAMLIGQPRARGFILDGYGVFFSVEIPTLQPSVAWSMQMMQREQEIAAQALQQLQKIVESLPDGESRARGQQYLKRVQQQVGPVPQRQQTTDSAGAIVQAALEDDPDTQYAKAVITACVDAMTEHSKPMDLGPDEWFTIALRGSEATMLQGQLDDLTTVVLRIRGSDLSDYLAGRLTRDQVRGKVEVRQF